MAEYTTKFIPVIGDTFGRWTVVSSEVKKGSQVGGSEVRSAHWFVECECGLRSWRNASRLLEGKTNGCKACCRNSDGENSRIVSFVRKFRRSATERGIDFSENITPLFVENLFTAQDKKCAVSGVDISFLDKWKDQKGYSCSLDRIDSKLPYTIENVQLVHKVVNMIKWTLSTQELIEWAEIIVKHNKGDLWTTLI